MRTAKTVRRALGTTVTLLLLVPSLAFAHEGRYTFSGEITSLTSSTGAGLCANTSEGDTLSYTLIIDTDDTASGSIFPLAGFEGDCDFFDSSANGFQDSSTETRFESIIFCSGAPFRLSMGFGTFVDPSDPDQFESDIDGASITYSFAGSDCFIDGTVENTVVDQDSDGDGVLDSVDSCPSEDATGFDADGDGCIDVVDTDGDGVPDSADSCPSEDATGFDADGDGCLDDTDGDGVTDDLDVCQGDDAEGDADLDGVCADEDLCDDDVDKVAPGDCGCGVADEDANGNGTVDCLESNAWYLDPDFSWISLDDSCQFALFTGDMRLLGGAHPSDFRDSGSSALDVTITLGEDEDVVLSESDIDIDVWTCAAYSFEYWEAWESTADAFGGFLWTSSSYYIAENDAGLPSSVGELYSRYILSDRTGLTVDYHDATLPLTITVDGTHLVTIDEDKSITTSLRSRKRKGRVHVVLPEPMGEGSEVVWYRDADPTDGYDDEVYSHEATDEGDFSGSWFTDDGNFVLFADLDGVSADDYATATAGVSMTIGTADSEEATAEFEIDYCEIGDHWLFLDGID
ncbi:MAG: hypothetical protein AAFV53_15125 [Myxococcota bacterium]